MRRSAERRASSTERRSGVPTYGGSNPRKRSSSMDRLSNFGTNFGRQSTSGRPSVAPLRVRNEGNIKTKNSSHDPRGSFGWKPQSSGAGLLGSSRKTPQKRGSIYSRTSGVGVASHNGIPKDPRKIQDRSLQHKFIGNVLEFLIENGYQHQVSAKSLASPTTKDFLKIFEFLYGQFEPKFKLGKKPEDEVPVLLKQLKYPFLISKSSIFAVGTPHIWPSVLAALDWMVSLLKLSRNVNVDDTLFLSSEGDFDEIPEAKIQNDYNEKTYEEFLQGHDTFEDCDAKLAQMLDHKYYGIHGNVDTLEEEGKRLEIEYDNLIKDTEKLTGQRMKLAAAKTDLQTWYQFAETMSAHEKNFQVQCSNTEQELHALSLECEEIGAKMKQMQQIYDTQELTPADINRINLERQELRRKKDSLEKQSSEYDEDIWNYEKEMAKILERVESKCSGYNKRARNLRLIPNTAENAFGVDYELSSSSANYESSNFQNILKPALNELKKRCGESIRQQEIEKIEAANSYEQVEELNDELRTESDMVDTKLKRLDEEYDVKKQIHQRDHQKSQEMIDYLQKTMLDSRAAEKQTADEMEQQLWEFVRQGKGRIEQKIQERKQYDTFLNAINHKIISHREAISKQIETLNKESLTELKKVEEETKAIKEM